MRFLAGCRSNLASRGHLRGCYAGGRTRSLASGRCAPDRRRVARPRLAGGVSGYPRDDRLTRTVQDGFVAWLDISGGAVFGALNPALSAEIAIPLFSEERSHSIWSELSWSSSVFIRKPASRCRAANKLPRI